MEPWFQQPRGPVSGLLFPGDAAETPLHPARPSTCSPAELCTQCPQEGDTPPPAPPATRELLRADTSAHSPGADRGAHEHIIEHEEPALLGFHDLTPVIVDSLYHVVRADEVAIAAA